MEFHCEIRHPRPLSALINDAKGLLTKVVTKVSCYQDFHFIGFCTFLYSYSASKTQTKFGEILSLAIKHFSKIINLLLRPFVCFSFQNLKVMWLVPNNISLFVLEVAKQE